MALLAACALAGCGTRGPLYVPGIPNDAPWPYPEPPGKNSAARKAVPADPVPATSDYDR
jgi:predicted small lipoprotein YifL